MVRDSRGLTRWACTPCEGNGQASVWQEAEGPRAPWMPSLGASTLNFSSTSQEQGAARPDPDLRHSPVAPLLRAEASDSLGRGPYRPDPSPQGLQPEFTFPAST